MLAVTSVGHRNQSIPIDPFRVPPENQEQIAEEEQPIEHMVKRKVDTEIDEKKLPAEDR
jgi:hypothetical protein